MRKRIINIVVGLCFSVVLGIVLASLMGIIGTSIKRQKLVSLDQLFYGEFLEEQEDTETEKETQFETMMSDERSVNGEENGSVQETEFPITIYDEYHEYGDSNIVILD